MGKNQHGDDSGDIHNRAVLGNLDLPPAGLEFDVVEDKAGFLRRQLEDIKAYEKGLNNETDATGLMLVMESIASGRAGTGLACREMVDILSRQSFRENIPADVPEGVRVANKKGLDIYHHVAGRS
jgi:hypothetical protein